VAEAKIPKDLLEDAPVEVLPPVATAAVELPFTSLPWETFERLVVRLALRQGDVAHAQRFGDRGQEQGGIDIYARTAKRPYVVYQCKQVASLAPSDLTRAIERFLEGEWAEKATEFVYCTSQSTASTQIARAIEKEAERLSARVPSTALTIWGAEKLSELLETEHDLVVRFFGEAWFERFSPAAAARLAQPSPQSVVNDLKAELVSMSAKPLVVTLNWARGSLRESVDRYSSDRPEQFARFVAQVGEGFDAARIRGLIEIPPAWFDDATASDWQFLAEVAEARGEWSAAADASIKSASLTTDDYAKAGHLASAAAAAGVGEDRKRREALLGEARRVFPSHPKVLVIGLDQEAAPGDQLRALADASPDDPRDLALVEGQRTLAYLRLGQIADAERHLAAAQAVLPDSLLTRSMAVCVEVQRGRLAVMEARPLRTMSLADAAEEALKLRDEFLKDRRYGEAARMLMLAADANAVLWRHDRAGRLLRSATAEERAAEDSAEVLGFSALRAMRFRVALEVTEQAPSNEAVTLIRASAQREVGTPAEKERALAALDELVSGTGYEAVHAAYLRLATTIDSDAPWSDEAEVRLNRAGYERQALTAKAYRACWRGQRLELAHEVLGPDADKPWAKTLLFRCSLMQKNHSTIKQAALAVLAAGPSQSVRVDAGQALALCGDFDRAYEVLLQPAEDPNTPTKNRADAYAVLVRIAGREWNKWTLAGELYDEWLALEGHDPRALPWGPMVYRRRGIGR